MEAVRPDPVEYGVARFLRPGQNESGDEYVVRQSNNKALLAVIDGIGHGPEAAYAARVAIGVLEKSMEVNLSELIEICHRELRTTRGAVLSVASLDLSAGVMSWLGIGNVQAILLRTGGEKKSTRETLLLRPGVVGSQLPVLQPDMLQVSRGDMLFLATDGVRPEFREDLSSSELPQLAATRLLNRFGRKDDDALVLVSRVAPPAI